MEETYEDSINFVLSEISRIAKMDPREALKMPFPDNMAMLPHPSGSGSLLCGMQAYRRLQNISELSLSRSQLAGKVSSEKVFNNLKSIVVERFLKEKREVNEKEVSRAISSAIKKAGTNIVDLTHYIPCHLGHLKSPKKFSIGPVSFKQADDVFQEINSACQSYLSLEKGDQSVKEKLLENTSSYYRSFGWIAEIRIDGCEESISRERAMRMAQNAIDCLHLYLGAAYSNHMRVGGPYFYTDKRGHITVDERQVARISMSVDWLSHNLPEGWWKQLNQEEQDKDLMALIGTAISAGNDLPEASPLALRFLDALSWYGEAIRDHFEASRLIKYVTAMERILTTKNEDELVEVFSARGAALIFYPKEDSLEALQKRFKKVYNMRSNLVHGSLSPRTLNLGKNLREAEDLAKRVLFRSIQFFREDGIKANDVSAKQLDKNYDTLRKWALEANENH